MGGLVAAFANPRPLLLLLPAARQALLRAQESQRLLGSCSDEVWRLIHECLALLAGWKSEQEDVLDVNEDTHEEMPADQLAPHLALNMEAAKVGRRGNRWGGGG